MSSREDEPLLGQPGDVRQEESESFLKNLYIGTAPLAQAGILILVANVWVAIFAHGASVFSVHPLLNSFSLLVLTQSILLLQPTHTAIQKRTGARLHALLNSLALSSFIVALVIVERSKAGRKQPHHFESPHAILGLITYTLVFVQALGGVCMFFFPRAAFGSDETAKAVYKYHRASGYLVLTLGLATVCAATQTSFNKAVLHVELWVIVTASVLTLVGLLPRVKLQKLGLKQNT